MALTSFILGTHPALSLAELKSVLGDVKFVAVGKEAVIVDMGHETWSMEQLQKRLGGTVKIGVVHEAWNMKHEALIESVAQTVLDVLGTARTRVYFGISVYEACLTSGGAGTLVQQTRRSCKLTGPEIKRALQEHYERVRWAVSREPVLSSVAVVKNKLLPPEGVEIQLLLGSRICYVGHTETVQPFEEYGARDFGRPSRDDRSGMIPPKLAQIMVNLAQVKYGSTILDPFCGSGTILQEALLLGHNVLGGDASTTAVTGTKQNLEWLTRTVIARSRGDAAISKMDGDRHIPPSAGLAMTTSSGTWRVEEHNVLTLSQWIKPGQVDAIVTEPYLGPQHASKLQVNETVVELSQLYLKVFEQFAKILTSGQKVVMVWPVFTGGRERVFLPIADEVVKLGFSLLTKRGELMYGREGQRVWREIVIWQK